MRLIPKSVHVAFEQIFHSINIDLCLKCKYDASPSTCKCDASERPSFRTVINYFMHFEHRRVAIAAIDKFLLSGGRAEPCCCPANLTVCVRFFSLVTPQMTSC